MKDSIKTLDSITYYEIEFGFKEKVYCSQEDAVLYRKKLKNKEELPEDIYCEKANGDYSFFTVRDNNVSDEEKTRLLVYQNALHIRTIKKCVAFLAGLAGVGLFAAIIILLNLIIK